MKTVTGSLEPTASAKKEFVPYIGLKPFSEQEKDRFFGRDREISILLDKIRANRLTLLLAASGVGKSSLLQAGIMPALRADGRTELIYHRDWATEPGAVFRQSISSHFSKKYSLAALNEQFGKLALKDLLLACTLFSSGQQIILLDQFEEFFNYQRFRAEFLPFIEELSAAILDRSLPASFVFSMREDFALELNAFKPFLPGVFDSYFRLEKLTRDQARLAIEEPLKPTGWRFEQDGSKSLLEEVLNDLAKREQERQFGVRELLNLNELPLLVEPPHLQIVCQELWDNHRDKSVKQITHAAYQKAGRAEGILKTYFLSKIGQFSKKEQALASAAFDHLVGQRATKIAHPLDRLAELTRADASLLRLVLEQIDKANRVWEKHFHDDAKELFDWDDDAHFFGQLTAKLKKPVELDANLLKLVLDKLQDCAVLRRQKRGEEFWYELYHDIFSESIDAWNREFKHRQRVKRLTVGAAAVLLAGGLLFAGNNWQANYYGRYLQLSSKDSLSERIEVCQGTANGWDMFHQRRFLHESPFLRQELEADKRFERSIVEDRDNAQANLVGRLPLLERLPRYAENGLYGKVDELAENILGSKEDALISSLPDQLADVRTKKSLTLLSDKRQDKTKIVAALTQLGDIAALVKLLADADTDVRRSTAVALGKLGDSAAVPELIKLLADADVEVRLNVAIVLGKLGDSAAAPELVKLLANEYVEVRRYAAAYLGDLGDSAAVPELVKLLADADVFVRLNAANSLGKLGDSAAMPELIKLLADGNVRHSAAKFLGNIGDSSVAPEIVKLLTDTIKEVRLNAAVALGNIGDSSVAPEIVKLLADTNTEVRLNAAIILGKLGDSSGLINLLADENATVRIYAAQSLDKLLGDSSGFIKLLADADASLRRYAAVALGKLGDSAAVPELVKLLADAKISMRIMAAAALGRLGDSAAVPELVKLLVDENEEVRRYAAAALGKLGDSSVAPELVKLLADADASVRAYVAESLGKLGDSSAAPELVKLLADADASVWRSAAIALGKLKEKAVAPILKRYLKDAELRDAAGNALVSMNISSPELLSWQEKQFKTAQNNLKENKKKKEAAAALGTVFKKESVTLLSSLLTDADQEVVKAAIESLGSIGEYHPGLVQAEQLLKLTAHDNFNLRQTAIASLGQLISFQGQEPPADLQELDKKIRPALHDFLFAEKKNFADRLAALDALGATGRQDCAAEIHELLKKLEQDKDESLRYRSLLWLGRMAYSPAQEHIKDELEKLAQEKAAWRKERDSDKKENISSSEFDTKTQDKSWRKEHWEYMLGNALARIDSEKTGVELLGHPLYQVRQGAIRALAGKVASADKDGAGAALIGKIIQAHQDFDPADLPSPFPYTAFQAIDLALWNLEYTGKQEDVTTLQDIRAHLKPCRVPGQKEAIEERLEWTIERLESKLKQDEKQPAVSP